MSTKQDQSGSQADNTYVINSEDAAEMARLVRQNQLVTQGMGGLFPEGIDLAGVHRILDVACGPGAGYLRRHWHTLTSTLWEWISVRG